MCFAGPRSPRPPPFAPPPPRPVARLRSTASSLLWRGLTSRARSSPAKAHRLPDADRCSPRPPGRTRDLSGSDVLPSCVMGSSTTAERQRLAIAALPMLPSALSTASASAMCNFRGSIAHPTRSLCTLRNRRRRRPRNTRYQAGATPYLGRTSTGWITSASPDALTIYLHYGACITDCGRDAHYCAPPAQNRTCGFPAYGSHLGCLTAKRWLFAACRTRSSAWVTRARICVRCVLCWSAFPSAPALRSTGSSAGCPASFVGFLATMAGSDFSRPFIAG